MTDTTPAQYVGAAVRYVRVGRAGLPTLHLALRALNQAFAACNRAKDNRARASVVRMRNWINAEIRRLG